MSDEGTDFGDAAAAIAEERYDRQYDKGFAHLALQIAFPTYSFADDQAEEVISIDRRGDLGVDGLYIDEDGQRILLFQAKSSSSLSDTELHDEISAFVRALSKLQSDEWVAKAHAEMKVLANEAREAIGKGYEVTFSFATDSHINDVVRSGFEDLSEAPAASTLELLDAADLDARYRKLLLGEIGKPTDVQFTVRTKQMHIPESDQPVVYMTLPAREYVAACKSYDTELFRYNPRLYLNRNVVNRRIEKSLKNYSERKYFHLLNNGITAVCQEFRVDDAGAETKVIRVADFQVVNGCQTTITLFNNSAEFAGSDECLVDLKIIQSVGLRDLISKATNTQTAIVAEDSFANEPEQGKIHNLMRRHSPSYFYSPKRGLWEQLKSPDKRIYEDEKRVLGKYRKLTSKELAAVCLAIFGEPESAKDKPRIVFEKVDGKDSDKYERIFKVRNAASQWLLPFELFRHANALVKRERSKDPDAERPRIGEYGRYRMVHLGYSYLHELAGGESPDKHPDFLSASISEDFLARIDDWAPNLLEVALDALVDGLSDAQARRESSGLREFFREKKHQQLLSDRFRRALQQTERLATRAKESLPEHLGFGSIAHSSSR